MAIVGFNFNSITVEKKEIGKGKISISNNVAIKDVEAKDISLGKQTQSSLKFIFDFTSKYEPNVGSIHLVGDVLYLGEAKQTKDIVDGWKKNKKLPKEIMASILNTVLAKCNVQALILSQDVNLPPPIPMPKVKAEENPKEYIG